jgi:hypothetical protein
MNKLPYDRPMIRVLNLGSMLDICNNTSNTESLDPGTGTWSNSIYDEFDQ